MVPWFKALVVAGAVAQPPAGEALRGPEVGGGAARATLVSFDMRGRLRALDSAAELEAVRLLGLAGAERERVEGVVAARAARVDAFVAENLLMLGELDTATKAERKLDAALLLAKLLERGWSLVEERPLREQVAAALSGPARERFGALVLEYRRAWRAQARADARAKGERPPAWALLMAERAAELGQEIAHSFERQEASGTLVADYLLAGVSLSEAQRAMVRRMKLEMLERTAARPTERDQQLLVLGIAAHLDEAQRGAVIRKVVK